jgi:MarR family transcriptional regulator, negative regulator of the multidrug operon emrRAB
MDSGDSKSRTANLLGALGLALADSQSRILYEASGLSVTDAAALNAVGQEPGRSIESVRVALGISHPGTVRTIDRLVAAGLVERSQGTDGRSVGLVPTELGRDLFRKQSKARSAWLRTLTSQLSEPEQAVLPRILEVLLDALTGDEADGEHICRMCLERVCPQAQCPVTLANTS